MRKQHGFSLLELLTVLAVMSVVSTIGTMAFFRITDRWNETTIRYAMNTTAQHAFGQIRGDLGQTLSHSLSGIPLKGVRRLEEEKRYGRVPLEDDVLTFPVSYVNPLNGTMQRRMLQYRIDRTGSVPALVRAEGPLDAATPENQVERIADGVLAMRCSYYDGENWQPAWTADALPHAVRVSLVLQDANRPYEQIARVQTFALQVTTP